jgi:hypothetical protein
MSFESERMRERGQIRRGCHTTGGGSFVQQQPVFAPQAQVQARTPFSVLGAWTARRGHRAGMPLRHPKRRRRERLTLVYSDKHLSKTLSKAVSQLATDLNCLSKTQIFNLSKRTGTVF